MGPNVLLVVLDTARADALEPYGAKAGSSPAVAQLAATGQKADVAVATSSWTVPSHASLFSGRLPRALGLGRTAEDRPEGFHQIMRSHHDRLLPTLLSGHGYETAGLSANLWVSPESGFDTGFDRFTYVPSQRGAEIGDRSWRGRVKWTLEAVRARVDDGASHIEQQLAAWAANRDRQPFFWFVNLVECHSPYLPPKPYNDLGLASRVRAGHDAQEHQTFGAFATACLGRFEVSDESLERMRHLYGASIRYMDDWLARVLSMLDRHGLLDETLVLLTSDHGENFGECSLTGHSFSLDDRLIRIPMIAAGPGAPSFDGVVSLADVPRFIAGAVGLDEHPYEAAVADGIAVAELDMPCGPDDPAGLAAIEELGLGPEAHRILVTPLTCATDGRYKLLRRGRDEVLIDLDQDPLETASRDWSATVPDSADPQLVNRLRTALDRAKANEVAPRPRMPVAQADVDVDDLQRRMELLGYL